MKYSKAVYVTLRDIEGNLNRGYDVYSNRIVNNERGHLEEHYEKTKDFSCQYDSNRDAVICTCKRTKREEYRYFDTSRQVYRSQRYSSAKGFTDVGVGSVKTVPKKRVRRVYLLPDTEDRGVGSSDLSSFIRRTRHGPSSYYDQKKTSSKCVGGVMECQNTPVINERLSPICKTKSGCTSPRKASFEGEKNKDNHCIIPDPVVNLVIGRKHASRNKTNKEQGATILQETPTYTTQADKKYKASLPNTSKIKPTVSVSEEKDFSSDSLVQHVHNLENPSSFKHSKTSIDTMENRLEREYIKMLATIPKQDKPIAEVHPVRDCTSASLRKRFEALRLSFIKKEVSREHGIVIKSSSHNSVASKKDVSITSDPPSLEARSYTNTKKYSPNPSPYYKYEDVPQTSYRDSVTGRKRSSHWSTHAVDSNCQDVKGMFKLWGKKFNLEEDSYNKSSPYTTPVEPMKQKKKVEIILSKEVIETPKKEGKRFSFFRRKNKEKAKQPYKSKKGVTAGRCEVGDGLTIKIGAANEFTPEVTRIKSEHNPDGYDDNLRKARLQRCLNKENDSRNSVKIRWNNEMYATSSSTVIELMEYIYKNTGIVFTSKSEVTATSAPTTATVEDPSYHPHKNPHVSFMQQSIQAWMIPKMIIDKTIDMPKSKKKKDIEVSFSNHKWFIEKSKAFSQKIELVLHSKNFVKKDAARSAEYIVIDIPKGYFLESSSEDEESQSSDEQVYNIVEYETAPSSSYLKKKRIDRKMDTGDHETDIRVRANVKDNADKETDVQERVIQTPLLHRDVVVQGSNVYVPKRCDVISVGIITQHTHNRDIKDIKIPGLKIQDVITDDESTHTMAPQKKCELAENYLQDYYRHCVPLGMDLYSWCISDSNLRASSDNNSLNSFNNQCDGTKSCPNIYDDFQASAVVSSCTNSSRSQGMVVDETTTYYNTLKKKSADGKRVLPKDSVEVLKRRKIYAANNVKADWCTSPGYEPLSKPSILDKFSQKSTCDAGNSKNKSKKHVSLKDVCKIGPSIISFKGSVGSTCKKREPCMKHARVVPEPKCEMLPAPCLDTCTKEKKPPCSKKGSPTCLVPPPPICPVGSPSPCQPACPPKPPPCASCLEGNPPSASQSPPTMPFTSKRGLFSRFLPRRTFLKPSCVDSCSKIEKPPSSTKDTSPCASFSEASPPSPRRSPPTSPPESPDTSPPQSPDTSPKGSATPLSPPRSRLASPPNSRHRTKFSSSSSGQNPPCIKCSKEKTPPCSKKDWSPYSPHLEGSPPSTPRNLRRIKSSPPCSPKKTTPQKISSNYSPPRSTHLCGCNSQKSCGLPQCISSTKMQSANEKFPWPLKNQSPNNSGIHLKQSPSNKLSETSKYLAKKSNLSATKKEGGDCSSQCPSKVQAKTKRKERTEPLKPPILPLPSCQPTSPRPRSQSKMSGLHLKKLPLPRNTSNANKPGCKVIRLNSTENLTIRMKPQTPSTEEIRDGCNIKIQDEGGQTLYERQEYEMDTTRARKHLVPDMYRDSRINRVATSKADIMNEKNLESCESKSNTSLSNIVEINLSLKFKQVDKTTDINIKNCGDTAKDNQNQKEVSQSSKDIYVLQDKINQSNDLEDAEKRDVNIKIIIKSYQHNSNKSKPKINHPNPMTNDEFSRKISDKFHTVSTGYSDVVDQQTYSIHRATFNFTDSADASKHIIQPSEELVNDELVEKGSINLTYNECVTKQSKHEHSISLLTANNIEKILPSDISHIKYSETNLEKTVDTLDEQTAIVLSAADNEEALFSDVEHSNIKIPKIRNKEEKKKILKQIFEDSNNSNNIGNNSKMQNIRQMLRAVLTSDSSGFDDDSVKHELAKELAYESTPNFLKNSDSMKNYYQFDSSMSDNRPSSNEIQEILYPTAINNSSDSAESRNEDEPCLCSHLAAKLNICENKNIKACCCRRNVKRDQEIDCKLIDDVTAKNIVNYVDVETQDSNIKGEHKKYGVTIGSNTMKIEANDIKDKKHRKLFNKIPKKWFTYSSSVTLRELNRETVLGLSDDDKVIILNTDSDDSKSYEKDVSVESNELKPIDILQLYETKRAVLEIYAKKTASDDEHLVAKLPKFIYNMESEIINYEDNNMFTDFCEFSARNVVMMSTTR